MDRLTPSRTVGVMALLIPQHGQLLTNPPTLVATFGTSDLLALLGVDTLGQELLTFAYLPICTVNVYQLNYETVGAKSEPTTSTGALMVPSGSASGCQGPRPIVEYAHGTSPIKNYDMAQLSGSNASSEALILAALFAAEGYIVVAPNYAGYDSSTLSYHPYLVGAQQAAEMMDVLTAARSALPLALAPTVTDNHKLFVTGYSQGGYVAMAATSAMQAAGQTVTASAPMSGPYALAAFGDALFLGEVDGSATENVALLTNGYQNAYGNLYTAPTDLFATPYANDIAGLLPSTTPISTIYSEGLLPENALFSSIPPASPYASITPATTPSDLAIVFAMGFASSDYLILNSYRLSYLQDEQANPDGGFPTTTTGLPAALPQNTLRQDLKTNDLRNWTPTMPTLLCGGDEDPEVFFFNTQLMQGYWSKSTPSPPVAARVGVPRRAGAGFEADAGAAELTGPGCLEQGVDAHIAGEIVRRALDRHLRAVSLDTHDISFTGEPSTSSSPTGDSLASQPLITTGYNPIGLMAADPPEPRISGRKRPCSYASANAVL